MKSKGLASWFAIWHPRYRGILIQLTVAGALASGLVFIQDNLLGFLTQSLSVDPELASTAPQWLGAGSPARVLIFFVVAGALAAAVAYWKRFAAGKLAIRAKDDTEAEVLQHLLHKSDAFFSRHSPAETVNRLAIDLFRISQRRPHLMQAWGASLLLLGHLVFFFTRDWRLGVVALAACAAGALWTVLMTRPVKAMDARFLRQDDRVKSGFEDFLRAVSEVQVGRLYHKIRRRFGELQDERSRTFLRFVRLDSALVIGNRAASLAAFVGMIAVVLYMRSTGSTGVALALVPVVIWALPALFRNAADLVYVHMEFELAQTSMKRLLEYEAQVDEKPERQPAEPPPEAKPLRVEDATYRYAAPGGKLQGGIAGVSTSFEPGQWTAVAGAAGSGKSTLMQLLLGRLEPQEGRVLYGDKPLGAASEAGLGSLLSVVPQASALLDATIGENLLFGSAGAGDGGLDADDLEVLERAGLAGICRAKALDMTPGDAAGLADVAGLRNRVRERLRSRCGAPVLPYEEGHFGRRHWVAECLAGGRCDRSRSVAILLGKPAERKLKALLPTGLGKELVELGRRVLRNSRQLLSIPNFHVHSQLAPFPLDERVWRLRTSSLGLEEGAALSDREALALCRVALTSSPAESAGEDDAGRWSGSGPAEDFAAEADVLKALLGEACRGFDFGALHPYLSWRENFIFGTLDVRNSRAGRLVDEAVLELVAEEGLAGRLTRAGLDFRVGRLGGNLSGGQGRLVALCRGLLRRTPVLVLDEPTSSLDPESRSRVARLLGEWKTGRVVVTVSHDTDFIRDADRIKLMDGGKLAAGGTFAELEKGSEVFRRIHGGG